MKPFRSTLLIISCLLISVITAQAQESSLHTAILSDADIDLFIKSFKPLNEDLIKLGDQYQNLNDPTALKAFASSEKVKSIFKKHGWSEGYYSKFTAITMSYASIQIDDELNKLPEDQRKMMEEYQINNFKDQVNPADLNKVKSKAIYEEDSFVSGLNEETKAILENLKKTGVNKK